MQSENEESNEAVDANGEIRETGTVSSDENSVVEEEKKQISINFQVELVPQPTEVSCWAAALAMVISFRDQASYTVEDIASSANMDITRGYGWNNIRAAVSTWGLREEGPMCAAPDYWASLLQTNGPLWIVEVANPGAHAVVLVGMHGDGTPEGTSVTLNNPWPPNQGVAEEKTFLDFEREFDLGAKANAMIVHK
jgi:Papain-like cysteine protease AvrRpt2